MKWRVRVGECWIVRCVRVGGRGEVVVKRGREVSGRLPDRWRVWRLGGQGCGCSGGRFGVWGDEERGNWRVVRFLRDAMAWRRS